ncbi:hypothetical protein KKC44_00205 [Patescibacteria group bacterium]|nr:hypothetical protein [Patescibacteria group bacterium]MBU2259010.1 hypothetical protein [Patescibacteria group bacterium]
MFRRLSMIIGCFLSACVLSAAMPGPTAAAPSPLFERTGFLQWEPQVGDSMMIDTKNNFGYLIHNDGRFYRFALVTGQRKFVCYIGRCYNAATPNWTWRAMSKEIKGDRVTFGPSGRFIRLFKDGETNTAYGIHEYKYEDRIFESSGRYGSMGCIVVRSPVMDLVERTFDVNEGNFEVISQYGIESALFVWR